MLAPKRSEGSNEALSIVDPGSENHADPVRTIHGSDALLVLTGSMASANL
jgi:hypothetical protein